MTQIRTYILALIVALCSMSALAVEPSGTLPIMYINTENSASITSKETYINATYYIDPAGCSDIEAIGSKDNQLAMQIRGRGNYTWRSFDKKPYRIKLDKKAALLGMTKSKHFALLAHADDNRGFMRNAVGLELSRLIGMPWTPDDKPVEVMLNGKYIGLYFLTETIRVDSDRVNITEQADNVTDEDAVTGGWLVEIDNYDSDPHVSVYEGNSNYKINFTYKTPEVLSSEQTAYLTDQMSRINSLVYASDKSDCKWAEMVDIDDLARYYIVQELVDDYEAFHGSCYLYKDKGNDEKWHFGPVWDFGSAFNYDKSQFIYQGREYNQVWIGEMCKFPEFYNRVKAIWQDFVTEHYGDILTYINDYRDLISSAAATDASRWPQYGNSDLKSRVNQAKKRLIGSFEWLCKQWGGEIPEFEDEDESVTVYFIDNGEKTWTNVHTYMWDKTGELIGSWPGSSMTQTMLYGQTAWVYKFTPDKELSNDTGIIFNNSGYGSGNQTENLTLVNGGIYNREGLIAGVTPTLTNSNSASITCQFGSLTINCDKATVITVTRIDGTHFTINAPAGTSSYDMPHGFYIVNGKKFAL